jgi:general secretion pathway protein K
MTTPSSARLQRAASTFVSMFGALRTPRGTSRRISTLHAASVRHNRGSALLTVLWVSAALSAVAFSLSTTVRGETERVSTDLDSLRAYYLAQGAVEKGAIEMHWGRWYPDRPYPRGPGAVYYEFLTGKAYVEFIPELAKLDLNNMSGERWGRLLAAMGAQPEQAQAIAAGIVARKSGAQANTPFSAAPTFPGGAASFQEIEELMTVPGVTPELFYGTFVPNPDPRPDEPRLIRRSGLVDCVSMFGSSGAVDARTADPAVLAAVGVPPEGVRLLMEERSRGLLTDKALDALKPMLGPGAGNVTIAGHSIYTIRATARLRLADGKFSDVRRTVAAQVKFMPKDFDTWIHILRWYDSGTMPWSN